MDDGRTIQQVIADALGSAVHDSYMIVDTENMVAVTVHPSKNFVMFNMGIPFNEDFIYDAGMALN